jgi:hypothetical protein
MTTKNPHAVALGRKGGKKTGRKGFSAMDQEKANLIRKMAEDARKKKGDVGRSLWHSWLFWMKFQKSFPGAAAFIARLPALDKTHTWFGAPALETRHVI